MTSAPTKFISYTLCPSNKKITIVDGSISIVAGQGDFFISDSLTLKNVLHVPKLFANLVSIQKQTKDANYNVIFYPSHCVFQETGMRKMIGRAREIDGLYYLEGPSEQRKDGFPL